MTLQDPWMLLIMYLFVISVEALAVYISSLSRKEKIGVVGTLGAYNGVLFWMMT